ALDAEHHPVLGVEEARLQPAPVLVEKLFGDRREELRCDEERTLLLDDAVNRDVADFDWGGQDGAPFCELPARSALQVQLADEIALADRRALVPEDVVGRGRME